ncbi:MAG: hypothetical protein HQ567_02295 [Candidatus Nealsonbacteria bacterium]|nr:hypothetical protein [Candidatus Nealsonbacteria bacterium]
MKPVLQALLLADSVYQDAATGKHIIVGTFNRVTFKKDGAKPVAIEVNGEEKTLIPGGNRAICPCAYISLTDIRGKAQCVLRYVNLEQNTVLLQIQFAIECPDPLQTVEVALPMPMLPPIAGVHALELLCDDEPLGSHRITVEETKEENDVSDSE